MYQSIWEISYLWPRRIWCFIVGHDERPGNPLNYEDDYCDRCLIDWPQDRPEIPKLLNRAYVWAVNHGWPEAFDLWLMQHVKLPRWWEY